MSTRNVMTACVVLVLVLVSTFGMRADEQAILIELEPRSEALPTGVSASGAVVSGGFNEGKGGFYWMPTTGVIFAGGVQALGVSRDGHTIVGWARDSRGVQHAAIWIRGTEWRLLGSFGGSTLPCGLSLSQAQGVNSNGQTVVGFARPNGCEASHAFRWQESTGMVDLGSTVQGRTSRGLGVSADGMVVVGDQESAEGFNQGARWADGRQELMTGPEGPAGSALAANSDGSIVVGRVCVPSVGRVGDQSAWIWKAGGTTCLPAPRRLVSPGPPILVEAAATSEDGQVIGGSQGIGVDSNAVIWIGGQPAYLKEFLQANGLPNAFRTWINTGTISGISPDGRVLVGWGAAVGGFRGYIVILGSSRVIPS
jgi:probable HAF family extracellular repeat protein